MNVGPMASAEPSVFEAGAAAGFFMCRPHCAAMSEHGLPCAPGQQHLPEPPCDGLPWWWPAIIPQQCGVKPAMPVPESRKEMLRVSTRNVRGICPLVWALAIITRLL